MSAASWPSIAFGDDLRSKIAQANLLMIGAGGIGCELVKTLILTGFRVITMIDMDTIEISNLNRQFLFRKHHVGQSKAKVAAEAVQTFCPDAKIETMQENVKESRFDLNYFKQFDMVLNGLDNDEARRHVNRLCLATGTPLVESGTMGYRGQVSVHLKGESECYECVDRPKPKGHPVCTIRNTPDKPIHCVVWAKDLLFARLFGAPDVITDLDEVQQEAGEEKKADDDGISEFLRRDGEDSWQYATRIFIKVFDEDIRRLQRMEELWKTRARPDPISLATVVSDLKRPELTLNGAAPSASRYLKLDPQAVRNLPEVPDARRFVLADLKDCYLHERC